MFWKNSLSHLVFLCQKTSITRRCAWIWEICVMKNSAGMWLIDTAQKGEISFYTISSYYLLQCHVYSYIITKPFANRSTCTKRNIPVVVGIIGSGSHVHSDRRRPSQLGTSCRPRPWRVASWRCSVHRGALCWLAALRRPIKKWIIPIPMGTTSFASVCLIGFTWRPASSRSAISIFTSAAEWMKTNGLVASAVVRNKDE